MDRRATILMEDDPSLTREMAERALAKNPQVFIEHQPDNEPAPYVVVMMADGVSIWFACASEDVADDKLPHLRRLFTHMLAA